MGGYSEMTMSAAPWRCMRTRTSTRASRSAQHVTPRFIAGGLTANTGSVERSARSGSTRSGPDEPGDRGLTTGDVCHRPATWPGPCDLDPTLRAALARGLGHRSASIDEHLWSTSACVRSGPRFYGHSQ